ncbi:hypothetical protein FOMPIDRAFT_117796 [Fomitopsis schrenkii]|uniref:Uncharacterized protein n=1 Tax=Fomitopsis schrenkii TaxID=2126942 RepID=S8ETJ4_FOMSC|nr:hypothetical protein FOMPIDRAFT_117796 [Fomitopsis schrenkii]
MRVICYICSAQLNARQGPHMVAPKTCGNALAASGRLRSLTCLAGHMYCLDCTLGIIRNTLELRCPVCRQQFRTPGGLIHVHPKFGRDAYHLDLFRNILPRIVEESDKEREAVKRKEEQVTQDNERLDKQVGIQQEQIRLQSEALQETRLRIRQLNWRAVRLRRQIEKEPARTTRLAHPGIAHGVESWGFVLVGGTLTTSPALNGEETCR